jgi:DNA-binding PadR family transcriptional regulator
MFDKIVLGFLMETKMTGYEIKKTMEKSTNFFFNTSYGNIYPTLKKLEEAGHLTSEEEIKNGKLNKSYLITESGKHMFSQWLGENSDIAMIRDEALCRLFFYSHLEKDKIIEELNSYIGRLEAQAETMSKLRKKVQNYILDPWKMKSLDFGIDYYTYMRKSFQKILKEMGE